MKWERISLLQTLWEENRNTYIKFDSLWILHKIFHVYIFICWRVRFFCLKPLIYWTDIMEFVCVCLFLLFFIVNLWYEREILNVTEWKYCILFKFLKNGNICAVTNMIEAFDMPCMLFCCSFSYCCSYFNLWFCAGNSIWQEYYTLYTIYDICVCVCLCPKMEKNRMN